MLERWPDARIEILLETPSGGMGAGQLVSNQGHMHMQTRYLTLAVAAILMSSSMSLAQTASPPLHAAAPAVNSSNWLTGEQAGQWRASKMKGLNVYNGENQKIGDISELIVDHSGKIVAVVIGVGGFLGIGEHDVAVPFNELSWSPATTGTSGQASQSYPDRVVLRMSKEQLKAAPEFKYAK
jgi:sporulation protein YlmC with PRC-barrel domain